MPLCNTYHQRFHFLTEFAWCYDRDKSETKHGCCKRSLFLNEQLAKEYYLVEKRLWLQSKVDGYRDRLKNLSGSFKPRYGGQ